MTPLRFALFALLIFAAPAFGQGRAADDFISSDAMIPARDGVKLHVKIFTPKKMTEPLPIIMSRTPYGVERSGRELNSYMRSLAEERYIFVFADIRGKFGSEGTFVMQRPARSDKTSLDEGTDTFDTIDWLIKNVPNNNGRVGMLGISYDGWTTIMAAIEPHPALKAISPQASPADMWLGDDFHHNGAFRLSYGFEYAAMLESEKELKDFTFDRYDTFDWYLKLGPLSNVNSKYLHGKIPTWNDYVKHPNYDEFWQKQTLIPHLKEVNVPTLNVAGWWDQEDFYGPVAIYDALEKHDKKNLNYLVVGPWNHGGWSGGDGDRLGSIRFAGAPGRYFRDKIQAPWFAFYLKDKGKLDLPEALTYEAGTNRWQRWEHWPPTDRTGQRKLYLGPNHTLTFTAPIEEKAADEFVSDPAHPVPYRKRPIQATYFSGGSRWPTWQVEDQRFIADRADVLCYESEPLKEDLTIAGNVIAKLFAATTGSDADWVVKLIDVYPEEMPRNWDLAGYQLMVSGEVFRGRYRNSFEKPEPIPSGEVLEYKIGLHTQNYTFLKGHRLMVQVQSSWFPVIDRNPQKYVPNIFEAKGGGFSESHAQHQPQRETAVLRGDFGGEGERAVRNAFRLPLRC